MPVFGRLLAASLLLAFGSAHAAETGADPLTTPNSPLYQPSPEVRAQVREVIGKGKAPQTQVVAPPAGETAPPQPGGGNPVPHDLVPHDLVAAAQRELAALGYDPGPADGVVGARTRRALMAFQADKGLPADGKLTYDLLSKLMVRATAPVAAPPPAPPPAEPAAVPFSVRRALGKTVHALPGDLLGTVDDFVVNPDRSLGGMVVATSNGYGTHEGKVVVPFAQVRHAVTRAAVVLPLDADKALPLRDKAQKMELAEGQWLLSHVTGGAARRNGETVGKVQDVTADTDGRLVSLSIRQGDAAREVPAADAIPAEHGVDLAR
ncbi:MAG: peptidoglycan-binding protein [Magnetospirillum sp.]|nr:peptidoglycan-binding protein [Magnetospirillum sp.]